MTAEGVAEPSAAARRQQRAAADAVHANHAATGHGRSDDDASRGQNVPGRSMAPDPRAGLAQLAAYGSVQPLSQASAPSLATGMPTSGLPGTTLNSPSQLQMALMSGSLSPYDMYARQQTSGFGSM